METVRLMLPDRRNAQPEWEVTDEVGQVIGFIQQLRIGRSTVVFYKAIGWNAERQQKIDLNNSSSFDERLEALREYQRKPEETLGIYLV